MFAVEDSCTEIYLYQMQIFWDYTPCPMPKSALLSNSYVTGSIMRSRFWCIESTCSDLTLCLCDKQLSNVQKVVFSDVSVGPKPLGGSQWLHTCSNNFVGSQNMTIPGKFTSQYTISLDEVARYWYWALLLVRKRISLNIPVIATQTLYQLTIKERNNLQIPGTNLNFGAD